MCKYQDLYKAMKDLKPTFYVGLVVVNKEKTKILIGKRSDNGYWVMPGGGAGMDESPREAIIREAYEEANLHLRPIQLKDLPTIQLKGNRLCHCFLVAVDPKDQKIHSNNDVDKEVTQWIWHPIDKPLPGEMEPGRATTLNNAKLKLKKLKKAESDLAETLAKAIVSNPQADIDINTAEQSQDEMAARPHCEWCIKIEDAVKDAYYGEEPKTIDLPDQRQLAIAKVDDGIYSGFVRNANPESGEYGETLVNLEKLTPESMVQALKAKGYLPKATPKPEPVQASSKYDQLQSILESFNNPTIHIHLD